MMIRNPKFIEGWEVEWCHSLGNQDDPTSFNPDACEYYGRHFPDKQSAIAFAKRILPQDKIGEVRVTAFHMKHFELGFYHKEYDGDSEFINDETK